MTVPADVAAMVDNTRDNLTSYWVPMLDRLEQRGGELPDDEVLACAPDHVAETARHADVLIPTVSPIPAAAFDVQGLVDLNRTGLDLCCQGRITKGWSRTSPRSPCRDPCW